MAERSIPAALPPVPAGAAPRFVGRWAAEADNCDEGRVWVIQAGSLQSATDIPCVFDRVDVTQAGYSVATVCQAAGRPLPGRLTLTLSAYGQGSSMTLAGGPFKTPVALQRCPA